MSNSIQGAVKRAEKLAVMGKVRKVWGKRAAGKVKLGEFGL